MSIAPEIAHLWGAVESAAPNDPLPLLIVADRCAELHPLFPKGGWADFEFTLRWCAGRERRPYRTSQVKFPWCWVCDRDRYRRLSRPEVQRRKYAVLPRELFQIENGDAESNSWRTNFDAYESLNRCLRRLRRILAAPTVTIPPSPEVVKAGPVTCATCGLMRARTKFDCPVCRSSEVQA